MVALEGVPNEGKSWRGVYKLKEEPEKGGSEEEKKEMRRKKQRETREKKGRRDNGITFQKKNIRETDSKPETGLRGNLGGKCYS